MIINQLAIVEYNEGTAWLNKKKYDKAMRFFKSSLKNGGGEMPELWLNMGNCHKAANDYHAAAKCYEKALEIRPQYKLSENNLGLVYHGLGRDDDAYRVFNDSETRNAGYSDLLWNKGLHLMRMASTHNTGWEEAHKYYHFRFMKDSNPVRVKNDFGALPMWDGKRKERVLVAAEQGAGDIIQYARFIQPGWAFQADESLQAWLKQVLPGVVLADYHDWRNYDSWIAACELSRFFNPVSGQPWAYMGECEKEWDFGYVWEGNPDHANNHNRSTELGRFKRLLRHGSARSFQYGKAGFDKKPLPVKNYLDTANYLRKCRRLITVDTSIAHLAGSMGVETWVLLPQYDVDWRWGTNDSGDRSIWYDSVRLFRNNKGWNDVFDRVEEALIEANRNQQQIFDGVQQNAVEISESN